MKIFAKLLAALSVVALSLPVAAQQRAVMENTRTSNDTIYVSTPTKRLLVGTTVYDQPYADVQFYVKKKAVFADIVVIGTIISTSTQAQFDAVGVATASLRSDLSAETAARIAKDLEIAVATSSLRTDLSAETVARISADMSIGVATNSLRVDLSAETAARIAADIAIGFDTQTIRNDLSAETASRIAQDLVIGLDTATLRTDLIIETNARIAADNAIGVATNTLRIDLTAETAARISQDTAIAASTNTLQSNINAEAAARQAQDTFITASTNTLQSNINSEAAARQAQDTQIANSTNTLQTNINNEAAARAAQDTVIGASTQAIVDQKGQPNGIASLDGGGKVPVAQLPNSVMEYKGAWNPSTNSPYLTDGYPLANNGDVYRASVDGSTDTGHGPIAFFTGDFIIYSGTIWERSPMADGVSMVNGYTGAVVLVTDDIAEDGVPVNLWFTNARAQAAVQPQFNQVALDTTSLRTDLNSETSNRTSADTAIGVATGTLRTDLSAETAARIAQDVTIGASTNTLRNDLTTETAERVSADNAIAVSTTLSKIGTPTYSTLQHLANFALSPGVSSGGGLTDAGGGNLDVAAGTGFIRATDSDVATLSFINWSASLANAIPANTARYVGVAYNAGNPAVTLKTTESWDYDTEFPLGRVINEAGTLYIATYPWVSADNNANIIEKFDSIGMVARDNRLGGIILSNTGTRNVAVSAGTLLARMSEFPVSAFDTASAGSFVAYHRDGVGGWTRVAGQTQWNNTQYDDGDGTLGLIPVLSFSSRWFYRMTDGSVAMLYGQTVCSALSGCINEPPPSSVPDRINKMGVLIGRFIVMSGATTPDTTQSAFGTPFTAAAVTSHLNLADIGVNTHANLDTIVAAVGVSTQSLFVTKLASPTVSGTVGQVIALASDGTPTWTTPSGGGGSGHVIASGTVSGSTAGIIAGQLAQRTTLYFDTAGFELYDDQASSATVVKSKGYQYLVSTKTYPSGSSTASTLGPCVANSTATWTQGNNKALICFSGSTRANVEAYFGVGLVLDGAFIPGYSSTKGQNYTYESSAFGNENASFCVTTPVLTAGIHNACISAYTSGGTVFIPASSTLDSVAELSVIEMATGGSGFATPSSSQTSNGWAATSGVNTTFGAAIPGSTMTITTSGGDVDYQFTGSCRLNDTGNRMGLVVYQDGNVSLPAKLSASALDGTNTIADLGMGSPAIPTVEGNCSFTKTFRNVPAGVHSYSLAGAVNTGTWFACGTYGACSAMVREVRNGPGTGDVSSNGNNTMSGVNAFTGDNNFPSWTKYTKTNADFSSAALTNTITLATLPVNTVVHGVKIKHSTAFSGAGITAYTVSVGTGAGNGSQIYASPYDVFQVVASTAMQISNTLSSEGSGVYNLTATATSVGANLNAASGAGSVDIWVLKSVTP